MFSDEGLALSSTGFHQASFLPGSEPASSELSAGAPSLRCPAMTSWSWRQPGSTPPGRAASTPCPGWTPAWRWCSTLTMETARTPARRKEQLHGMWTLMVVHRGIPRLSPQPQASSVHCTHLQMFIPKHFALLEGQHWTMFSYFRTWYSYHKKANQIPLTNPSYKYCETFGNLLLFLLWREKGFWRHIYVSVQKHSCTLCTTMFVGIIKNKPMA